MASTSIKPESGTLATPDDLSQMRSLDEWLTLLKPDKLHITDTWNEGSTLSAFAFNDWMGVEKRHASNVWVNDWDEGGKHINSPALDQDRQGLRLHQPRTI